jgi:hypothetical protein
MATYYEFVIKGDDRDVIPYLAGFMAAAGARGIYFAEESGLHVQSLRERIRHHGEVQHVVCTGRARATLRNALAAASPRYRFEVKDERVLAKATFRFHVETPSRKVADRIRRSLEALPPNVAVAGFDPSEEVDPSSGGAQVYTPVHRYTFRARGDVEGDVAGVIEVRRKLSAIDFVDCEEIELHGA